MNPFPRNPLFPFTDVDAAACDAVIQEYSNNTEEALPVWLKKVEEIYPDRYTHGDPDESASGAAWGFFNERCDALGLEFRFGGEEEGW